MAWVDKNIEVRVVDDVNWELLKDVVYKDHDVEYRVPGATKDERGYITDFASVPRCTSWLYPRTGGYSAAAIVHDWLITDMLPTGLITSTRVDEVFREAMQALGVPWARRWLMWAGVRLGAMFNKKRRAGSLRTAPLVFLVMLLSAPVVLLPTLVVLHTTLLMSVVSFFLPDRAKVDSQKT